MIWEEKRKASQVFTEVQSFVAENNSVDQCFLKYGFEIYIRVARFGVPSPDFLARSKRFNRSGDSVPETCNSNKHYSFIH